MRHAQGDRNLTTRLTNESRHADPLKMDRLGLLGISKEP